MKLILILITFNTVFGIVFGLFWDPGYLFETAYSLAQRGQRAEAIAVYDQLINFHPDYCPQAYYNRGNSKCYLGDLSGALDDYETAIKLNPNYSMVYMGRAFAKAYRGQDEEAIADNTKAIALNPWHKEAFFNRGCVYMSIGKDAAALRDFKSALNIDPNFSSALINIEQINQSRQVSGSRI